MEGGVSWYLANGGEGAYVVARQVGQVVDHQLAKKIGLGLENCYQSVITFHTIGVVVYLQGPCCRSLQLVGVDRGDGSAPGCQVGGDGVHGSDGDGSYGGACGGGGGDIKWR